MDNGSSALVPSAATDGGDRERTPYHCKMPEPTTKPDTELKARPQEADVDSPDRQSPGLPFDPQDRKRGSLYLALVTAVFFLVWFTRYAMEGFVGLGVFSDVWLLGYVNSFFPHSFFPPDCEIMEWFRHFYRPLSWCMMYNVYHHLWDWWPYHIAFRTGIHLANAILLFGIARRLRLHPAASLSAAVLFLAPEGAHKLRPRQPPCFRGRSAFAK